MFSENPKSWVVSAKGGTVRYVSADGENLFEVAVSKGRERLGPYLEMCPPGATLEPMGDLVIIPPRSGYGVQRYGAGSHDSGANPVFKPTSASRMEKELRLTLNKMQAATNRLEARERALGSIERVPEAPVETPQSKEEPLVE
ncbi:hypothetical protein [Rhodobacter ferrooxidans]|uniref:Uncharacterized protein n=1 Tax=Rhodobacter ferrooxidans TaxID=371731 RepID=C8RZ58_9RHOB|nr:hypothetical protein [Rhodobacter sp. SW2]EEW26015.1 hypothetical protein Rsw2DRAFT_1086 [Rhodobacter sp. SW2]